MIYNHVTYSLSTNDLKMVKAIPAGGNWKNIPTSIPSKRLEKIRITGGRTTLYGRLLWDKPSYTITTYFNRPGNGAYIHPDQDRVISAREAARLQSFPDNYIFLSSKTSLCKQIGNAVPPLLAYFIAKQIKAKANVKNVLDLFCGAGGLSKGFEWAGFNILVANDNFSAACETYEYNHKHTELIEGDITLKEVKDKIINLSKKNKIDIVIGGPPCQGFSYAGKRMIDDPRNFLYKEFVNVVKRIKPKVFLLENVEGILTSNKGATFESIKENFTALGYKLFGKKMHAVKYGVPQKRKRVIIIGTLVGDPEEYFPKEILKDADKYITVRDAIDDLPKIEANGGENKMTIKNRNNNSYQKFLSQEIKIKALEKYISRNS